MILIMRYVLFMVACFILAHLCYKFAQTRENLWLWLIPAMIFVEAFGILAMICLVGYLLLFIVSLM